MLSLDSAAEIAGPSGSLTALLLGVTLLVLAGAVDTMAATGGGVEALLTAVTLVVGAALLVVVVVVVTAVVAAVGAG